MKTGEIAKIIGVDRKTIRNWIDDYGLQDFFSPSARGEDGQVQRTLTEADVLVLNTIRSLKANGIHNWNAIRTHLEAGHRETEFPLNAIAVDTRTITVEQAQQSARALATMAERDAALKRVSELEAEIEELRAANAALENEKDDIKEKLMREIMDLHRAIGKLEGKLEFYREQLNGQQGD